MSTKTQNPRFDKIDGLRAYAAIGIVLMHVQANLNIPLCGFVFENLIPSFTNFVFLFMIISGFATCCGYFEEFTTGRVSLAQFYKKRFLKTWPFFALLCVIDLAVSPSAESFYEVLANLTLCFGLIPNHGIEVIGVGWFLGLVFVFYMLFPFFCYLLSEKRRAWFAFCVALLLNYLCESHFGVGRMSISYSAVFFLLGGMIYIYREILQIIAERFTIWVILAIAGAAGLYFVCGENVPTMLVLYGLMLVFALGTKKNPVDLLENSFTKWLSNISMEIYLSHMVVFRALEMLLLERVSGLTGEQIYVIIALATTIGTAVFSFVTKKALVFLGRTLESINCMVGDSSDV